MMSQSTVKILISITETHSQDLKAAPNILYKGTKLPLDRKLK